MEPTLPRVPIYNAIAQRDGIPLFWFNIHCRVYSCISFVHELKCTFMIDAELDDKSIVPCSSVTNVPQTKITSLFTEANEVALQFKQSLSLLGRCHNIYN